MGHGRPAALLFYGEAGQVSKLLTDPDSFGYNQE
jgi:hypothetical protein